MKNNHLTENQLIDFVLRNLNRAEHLDATEHLRDCERCQVELNSWQSILGETENLQPSMGLEQRIHREIDRINEKKKKRWRWVRSVRRYVPGLVCILILFSVLLFQKVREADSHDQLVKQENTIMDRIDYHAELLPVYDQKNSGMSQSKDNVWYNPYTKKVFIEVNGFRYSGQLNDQIWRINDLWNHEFSQIQNEVEIFYLRPDLEPWLQLNIEPDGRFNFPTDQESILIDLSAQ